MRTAWPITIAGGVLVALATGGGLASLAYADPTPPPARPAEAVVSAPTVVTDADRRAELNDRLQTMLKDGKGKRLADPRPVRHPASRAAPRSGAQALRPAPRPQVLTLSSRPAATRAEPPSSIAPPPTRAFTLGSLGSLTRPHLDLKTPPIVPADPIECLTQAIYYEARSESEEGQAAVAAVVMNRSRSGRYPKDVCKVVYQRNSRTCQFTFTCDGAIGRRPVNPVQWARAERIAREVHEGRSQVRLPGASVNYHANYVRPSWGRRLERVRQIGAHIFYGAALPGFATPGASDEGRVETPPPQGIQFVHIPALDQAAASPSGTP